MGAAFLFLPNSGAQRNYGFAQKSPRILMLFCFGYAILVLMDENERDKITVSVKNPAAENAKHCYAAFGWTLEQDAEDDKYGDVRTLHFSRPHFLPHKDELQLLQVRLEIALNNVGFYDAKKNSRATVCGLLFAFLAAALLAVGIWLLRAFSGATYTVCGILLLAVAAAVVTCNSVLMHRIRQHDEVRCNALIQAEKQKIALLCVRAEELRKGEERDDA